MFQTFGPTKFLQYLGEVLQVVWRLPNRFTVTGSISGLGPFIIQRKDNLSEISLILMSGQDFANAEQTNGRTTCAIT